MVTGLALTVALLYLVPLGVGLLAHPLTGQPELRWPGGGDPMAVGTGWRAWWLVVPGVLALAGAVGAVLGAITGTVAGQVIAMAMIALPVMMRYGYDMRYATGVLAARP